MSTLLFKNYYPKNQNNKQPVILAGFDLDHTIIKPKSGNIFPKNNDDWILWNPIVKNKLQELNDNHLIVIFSNQKKLQSKEGFITKIDNIKKLLNINFIFMAAMDDDIYRKPRLGMFNHIQEFLEKDNITIDMKQSFYVGDMAGRKNDKYDTDLKFAMNMKLNFYTPEEYFLGDKKGNYKLSGYLLNSNKKENKEIEMNKLIIISGYPGSGKSYLAKKISGYILLSKDLFGTKFNKKLVENFELNKNIIVEGLFPTNKSRENIKVLADKYNYTTTYIHVNTSYELSYHLNLYRSIYSNGNKVPEIVYMKYRKDFEPINTNDWDYTTEYHPHISKKINQYFLY